MQMICDKVIILTTIGMQFKYYDVTVQETEREVIMYDNKDPNTWLIFYKNNIVQIQLNKTKGVENEKEV